MRSSALVLLCGVLVLSGAWQFNNPFGGDSSELTYAGQQVQFFDQILDHYSYLPAQFWKQRYYVNGNYYDPAKGPVLLYICGEGICNGVADQSWTALIAQATHALVITLEHRYYGDSLPFRTTSFEIENMKFLSSKQALRDIAFFIEELKKNHWYGIAPTTKWITIGGSYPGALSAWFRAKYPHLTVGALASSAVVEAVEDFQQFDEQIFLSLNKSGEYCVEAVRQLTALAEEKSLGPDRLAFQGQFQAEHLTTREFMFYWSDVLVFQVQYGNRSAFCASLKGKSLDQLLLLVTPLMLKVSPVDYGAYYLGDPVYALQDGRGGRSWYYQCCTEFSYFQTWSKQHPMRSKMLTIGFYRKWCEDIYGMGTWPAVNRTNVEYGALKMRASNLIMTNGDEDPWKWASLRQNYKGITAKVADCNDCGHCKDLHAPSKTDPKQITQIRDIQLLAINGWLK